MRIRQTTTTPRSQRATACILGAALFLFAVVASSTHASLVDVSSPTTSWTGIRYGSANGYDPVADAQGGSREGDIVGNAQNASVYTFFADRNTPSKTDGDLAFRIRVGEDSSPAGFKSAAFVGIITNRASGKIDLFIGVNNAGQANSIGIFGAGVGANVSPSTTSISNAVVSYTETATNYSWMAADSTSDPTGTNFDIDNGGQPDYFLTFSVPFSDIVAQLAALGITGITEDSTFSYVIATSTQGNALNQDINGVTGNVNSSATWSSLGALADATSPIAAVPEVNPAMLISLLLAAILGYTHFRQHRGRKLAPATVRSDRPPGQH